MFVQNLFQSLSPSEGKTEEVDDKGWGHVLKEKEKSLPVSVA